jgi:hypothetical protein
VHCSSHALHVKPAASAEALCMHRHDLTSSHFMPDRIVYLDGNLTCVYSNRPQSISACGFNQGATWFINAHKRVWKPEIHEDNRHDELIGVVTLRRVINVACRNDDGQVRVSRSFALLQLCCMAAMDKCVSHAALLQFCCKFVATQRWKGACLTAP